MCGQIAQTVLSPNTHATFEKTIALLIKAYPEAFAHCLTQATDLAVEDLRGQVDEAEVRAQFAALTDPVARDEFLAFIRSGVALQVQAERAREDRAELDEAYELVYKIVD